VVINYVKRSDARGTWLESHFNWQIRTFWYALLWAALVFVVSVPLAAPERRSAARARTRVVRKARGRRAPECHWAGGTGLASHRSSFSRNRRPRPPAGRESQDFKALHSRIKDIP